MNLHESGEMYLETIYLLSKTSDSVRATDVGEYMGYSKPSVSRAISILKSSGYVYTDDMGFLKLTDIGSDVAQKVYEKHLVLSEFLRKIGLDEETATSDACKMEHAVSDETYEAIRRHIESL